MIFVTQPTNIKRMRKERNAWKLSTKRKGTHPVEEGESKNSVCVFVVCIHTRRRGRGRNKFIAVVLIHSHRQIGLPKMRLAIQVTCCMHRKYNTTHSQEIYGKDDLDCVQLKPHISHQNLEHTVKCKVNLPPDSILSFTNSKISPYEPLVCHQNLS